MCPRVRNSFRKVSSRATARVCNYIYPIFNAHPLFPMHRQCNYLSRGYGFHVIYGHILPCDRYLDVCAARLQPLALLWNCTRRTWYDPLVGGMSRCRGFTCVRVGHFIFSWRTNAKIYQLVHYWWSWWSFVMHSPLQSLTTRTIVIKKQKVSRAFLTFFLLWWWRQKCSERVMVVQCFQRIWEHQKWAFRGAILIHEINKAAKRF